MGCLGELAERTGITVNNLSVLETGRARAVRFTTLEAICAALDCQPGDLLHWEPETGHEPVTHPVGSRCEEVPR